MNFEIFWKHFYDLRSKDEEDEDEDNKKPNQMKNGQNQWLPDDKDAGDESRK